MPWVDLNFIDGLRTSFYMQPNGGPYFYQAFDSEFGLIGQMAGVLRGPLAPQQGAAPPVPSATTLGVLAAGAGPGSGPSPDAVGSAGSVRGELHDQLLELVHPVLVRGDPVRPWAAGTMKGQGESF